MGTKIALVLGGGGSRSLAHIGVLDVLGREQIPIDLIVGTSMGGIIGAMFALGYTPAEMSGMVRRWQQNPLFNFKNLTTQSRQNQLRDFLVELFGTKTFADLPLPVIITAADMRHGVEIQLEEGELVSALLASSAMPGAFPTVSLNGLELGDGGVIDALATGVAYGREADRVIAVDVFPALKEDHPWNDPVSDFLGVQWTAFLPKGDKIPPLPTALWRAVRVVTWYVHRQRLAAHPPHVLLRPEVDHVVSLDFRDIESLIQAGVDEAERHLNQLRSLVVNNEQ
ncbi:MAG TPA: patatin-like phospholipase family protein [Anaerolineae bacterium]|nr:patatin-like phospholipase family protein [Anaerolineae bacterium]HMR66995.1 patatin-like phospholipase family protein [Anaerolineae bacterium]